jgi:hypothetical protein
MIRGLVAAAGLVLLWQAFVWLTGVPHFLLPSPWRVAQALVARADALAGHRLVTATEILAGLALGTLLGRRDGADARRLAGRAALAAAAAADQPGGAGLRHRAAADALVRLRHREQGRDGHDHHLLPRRHRLL